MTLMSALVKRVLGRRAGRGTPKPLMFRAQRALIWNSHYFNSLKECNSFNRAVWSSWRKYHNLIVMQVLS